MGASREMGHGVIHDPDSDQIDYPTQLSPELPE